MTSSQPQPSLNESKMLKYHHKYAAKRRYRRCKRDLRANMAMFLSLRSPIEMPDILHYTLYTLSTQKNEYEMELKAYRRLYSGLKRQLKRHFKTPPYLTRPKHVSVTHNRSITIAFL